MTASEARPSPRAVSEGYRRATQISSGGVIGSWGGIAAGIFGQKALGGMGGVSFVSQLAGSLSAIAFALVSGFVVYGVLGKTVGIRLTEEQEFAGADLSIHSIGAYPEDHIR